jgi:density-regulated protein
MPVEYCEWGGSYDKCREWLETEHADLAATMAKGEDRSSQRLRKGARKELAKVAAEDVTLTLLKRNKKKFVTLVKGMNTHEGVTLKEAARFFANKFSCGASPVKGTDDSIEIQGDKVSVLPDIIHKQWPHIPRDSIKAAGVGGSKKGRKKVASRGGRGRRRIQVPRD